MPYFPGIVTTLQALSEIRAGAAFWNLAISVSEIKQCPIITDLTGLPA
jgi:hypothetical protein